MSHIIFLSELAGKMEEIEQAIIQLAKTCKEPKGFIRNVEKSFRVPSNRKAGFFLGIGFVLFQHSYYSLALNSWNYSSKYFIKNEDKVGEYRSYIGIGNAHNMLMEFKDAIEYHRKALEIAKDKDSDQELSCYVSLGNDYQGLGCYKEAIKCFEEALKIAVHIHNRVGESGCYNNIGIAYYSLGDFNNAIEYHQKALEIAKDTRGREGKAQEQLCYGGLGNAYYRLGHFRTAIEYHQKSLEIAKDTEGREGRKGESACYNNLGNAYHSLEDFENAIACFEEARKITEDIKDRAGESACYNNLGAVCHTLGDLNNAIEYYQEAVEYHQKALEIAKDKDSNRELDCYVGLGNVHNSLGDWKQAIACYEEARKIAEDIQNRAAESACFNGLGNAYDSSGDFRNAIYYYKKSLEIAIETGDMDLERVVNFNLGRAYHKPNSKLKLAYDYCKRSIELSEVLAGRLVQEERRIGFYSRVSNAYQHMIPICLKLRKKNEAFEYVERSKSRAFLDLIAATEIKPTIELTGKFKFLLNDEEKYLAKLREIQMRHLRPFRSPVEPGEVEGVLENLNLIYEQMEDFDSEYVFMRRGKPLPQDKTLDMLSSQKKDVTLVEYYSTQDETFILVVSTKDRELHIEPVPVSIEKLGQYLENYRKEVVDYAKFGDIGDTWLGLSDYLIKPISKYLKHLKKDDLICFVPFGMLHYLPLHALELRGEPLITKHPVAYAPSASLIKFCKKKGSGKLQSCASFGVVFREEAKAVAELFNVRSYDQATKDTLLQNCADKDVIHFSCHGYFDDADPLSSGVKLYDKVLTAREIFNMKLDTELVTLSACQTGLSKRSQGDELVGLTRAFLYAGSPSVIVSLWSVDARSTQELMLEFYSLLQNGSDKATALQEAQKRIMKKKGYSHPYYWAPFVLVGDWQLAR